MRHPTGSNVTNHSFLFSLAPHSENLKYLRPILGLSTAMAFFDITQAASTCAVRSVSLCLSGLRSTEEAIKHRLPGLGIALRRTLDLAAHDGL